MVKIMNATGSDRTEIEILTVLYYSRFHISENTIAGKYRKASHDQSP